MSAQRHKRQLIAALAAVRARLFRALIGLDEHTLTGLALAEGLTGLQVLLYLAYLDQLDSQGLRRAGHGHRAHAFIDVGLRKHIVVEDKSHRDLGAAVAACRRGHREKMEALQALPPRATARSLTAFWEDDFEATTIAAWFERRMEREASLVAAIESARPPQSLAAAIGPKSLLRAALNAAQDDLLATVALLPAAGRARQPLVGDWSARDLAGHLADWDALFLHWFRTLLGRRSRAPYFDEDGDALNEHYAAARRRQSWAQAWAEAQAARGAFVRLVARTPEAELLRPRPGGSFPTAYHCAWSALEHVLHHAADLRAGLRLPFRNWLLHFEGPYT